MMYKYIGVLHSDCSLEIPLIYMHGADVSLQPDGETCVRVRSGSRKWSPGYHPELCCVLQWLHGEPPPPITSMSYSSKFGL